MHWDMLYDKQLSLLCIVMLSKLILLFCSFYMLNCKCGLMSFALWGCCPLGIVIILQGMMLSFVSPSCCL